MTKDPLTPAELAQKGLYRATRPYASTLIGAAYACTDDKYLSMTQKEFITEGLKGSGGRANPYELSVIYTELMRAAYGSLIEPYLETTNTE